MLSAYRKTIVAVVGAFLTWAGAAYVPDGHIDRVEAYALAIAIATALGVYAVTNEVPVAPEPIVLEPEPSSVKFLAAVPTGDPGNVKAPALTVVPSLTTSEVEEEHVPTTFPA